MDQNCIFCKIIHHEIPSYILYEDEKVMAILDAFPATKGHVLILCKDHYQNILECDEETLIHMTKTIQLIGKALLKTYACGMNVLSNIHEVAGQTVMHAHIHLLPVNEDGTKVNIQFASLKDIPLKEIQESILKSL